MRCKVFPSHIHLALIPNFHAYTTTVCRSPSQLPSQADLLGRVANYRVQWCPVATGTCCNHWRHNGKQIKCRMQTLWGTCCLCLSNTCTNITQACVHTKGQTLGWTIKSAHPNTVTQTRQLYSHMRTRALSVTASACHVWGCGMINHTRCRWPH